MTSEEYFKKRRAYDPFEPCERNNWYCTSTRSLCKKEKVGLGNRKPMLHLALSPSPSQGIHRGSWLWIMSLEVKHLGEFMRQEVGFPDELTTAAARFSLSWSCSLLSCFVSWRKVSYNTRSRRTQGSLHRNTELHQALHKVNAS